MYELFTEEKMGILTYRHVGKLSNFLLTKFDAFNFWNTLGNVTVSGHRMSMQYIFVFFPWENLLLLTVGLPDGLCQTKNPNFG
jgi:hypothetical protein